MAAAREARPAADPDRRQRPLFRLADRRACGHPRSRPGSADRGARAAEGNRAGRAARAPRRGGSGDGGAAAAHRQPAGRARLGGVARHRQRACRLAGEDGARRHRGGLPPSCSTRRATRCARPSRPASMPCCGRARWTRCGRCWRCNSTPRCRRCGRMACRNCPPTCAARSRWRRPAAGRTGHRPVHQAPGDLVPPPRAGRCRTRRI